DCRGGAGSARAGDLACGEKSGGATALNVGCRCDWKNPMTQARGGDLSARLESFGDPGKLFGWPAGDPNYVKRLALSERDVPMLVEVMRRFAEPQEVSDDYADFRWAAPIHAYR